MFHNVLIVITFLLFSGRSIGVCVCVDVKERKERGREIRRVFSTLTSYQISVKRHFNS